MIVKHIKWVQGVDGISHAIRQSEGKHHSARCGKYVHGEVFRISDEKQLQHKCTECMFRLAHALVPSTRERVPRCIIQGRGVHTGKHHNGKTANL